MNILQARIRAESRDLGRGVIKVDSFLNHQVDPALMHEVGNAFAEHFAALEPTKIMTVETGGITPAYATAAVLRVPLVIVRKRRAAGMPRDLLQESTRSQTRGEAIDLYASREFLTPHDRIVIIDDFLTNAQTLLALSRLAAGGGAQVAGIGVVIEKALEGGRDDLAELNVPVYALVRIGNIGAAGIEFLD